MKLSKGTVCQKKGSPYLHINISVDKKRRLVNTFYTLDKYDYVVNVELPIFKQKILSGELVFDEKEINSKTFEYYSLIFLETKKYLKDSTYRRYEFYVNRFNEVFGSRKISSFKTSEIKNYLYSLDIKPLTFRNYLNLFKCVFDEALHDEEIIKNPCSSIKVPKNIREEIEPFSVDEVNLILSSSSGFFRNFLATAFYTGCRTGEIFAMKWHNVDLKKKRIYIDSTYNEHYQESTPKTGKNRTVPIFDSLIPFLEEQRKITGLKTYVFYSDRGKLLHGYNLARYYWYPLLKRLKIPNRVLYNTRHTFVTNMINNSDFTLNQIAYWLGHSNIRTLTVHYNKYITSELENYDTNFDVFCNKNCNNDIVSA